MRDSLLLTSAALLAASSLASAQFPAHILTGDDSGDMFGTGVDGVGDVDGDGFDDFAVGASSDSDGGGGGGSASVFSGLTGALLYHFDASFTNEQYGATVAGRGDVNGDGVPDIAVSAPFYNGFGAIQGRVEVRSGLDGSLIWNFDGINATSLFGDTLAISADLNGDGFDDILVGASNDDGSSGDSGIVYAYSGFDGTSLYQVSGSNTSDQLGFSLGVVGDVNGDGTDDWIAGAPFYDVPATSAGQAFVCSGTNGAILYAINGDSQDDGFGRSVAGAGDINSDGRADFAIGAWRDDDGGADSGSVRIYSGMNGMELRRYDGTAGDRMGAGLANVGDYDGDGFDDLAVGSRFENGSGTVRIFSGFDGSVLGVVSGLGGPIGEEIGGRFDVNGDGLDEFIVGARNFDGSRGKAVVFSTVNLLGSPYCFGDGSGTACPCGNDSSGSEGCANSTGGGASLLASGSASVTADDLELDADGMLPNQPALLFAGLNATNGGAGQPFGDGLRCAGGSVVRLGVRIPNAQGAATWGPGLAAQAGWMAGDLRRLQVWYRDPSNSPCGSGFNLSNGFEVTFLP